MTAVSCLSKAVSKRPRNQAPVLSCEHRNSFMWPESSSMFFLLCKSYSIFFPCKCCLCCRQYNVSTQFTESISVRSLLKIGWPTNGLFTPHGWPCRRLHHFDGSVHVDSHTTLWQLFCPLEVPGGINYFSLFIFNLIIESLSIYC